MIKQEYKLSEREDSFICYMMNNHRGKENAILGKDLKKKWGDNRKMRMMIHDLRVNGYPICSGHEGYWFASTQDEVQNSIHYINSYIADLANIRSGLKQSIGRYFE
jgi:hypothetical protein